MNRAHFHNSGFTIIELSLVLIVFGILAAIIVPLAQSGHEDSLRRQDAKTMETAKEALLGYIRVNEGIPCVDASGIQVSTGCDATETLDILGVRSSDARRLNFAYDVNETLTLADLAASGTGFCAALANLIDPPIPPVTPAEPTLCDSVNGNTGDLACASEHSVALVLASRGSDRCLNLENSHGSAANDGVCPLAVVDNRTFENPARIQSKTMDDGYYDDQVLSVSPTELAEALDCPAGGGGGVGFSQCPAGESLVQVINGINNAQGISIDGACYTVAAGTSASLGCQVDSTAIGVYGNTSCATLFFSGTVSSLDSNTDGRVDIICNSTDCNSR